MVLWIAANLAVFAICGLAVRFGGPAERIGGCWVAANVIVQIVLTGGYMRSPTLQLLVDGIYATGLIPLAVIYVSWFIGIMAFVVCAAFTQEAVYLLADIPFSGTSTIVNNLVCLTSTLALLASTVASWMHRRRLERSGARLAVA